MTSILSGHHYRWLPGLHETIPKDRSFKVSAPCSRYSSAYVSSSGTFLVQNQYPGSCCHQRTRKNRKAFCSEADNTRKSDDSEDDDEDAYRSDSNEVNNDFLRENLERMIGTNDSSFNGTDLATLIRNKYGRSYDVQLIKKEFMGKNLLALNVMWKYVEQRSFPLTEEEYILRLDDVANTLRCWGAVSHIRNSLAKSRERPRIGKAVSIFIDMDESGGRANEWIYK